MSSPDWTVKARTYWKLGAANLARVAAYRLLLRAGYYRRRMPIEAFPGGPFFDWGSAEEGPARFPALADSARWSALADRVLRGELPVFASHWCRTGFPPDWRRSVITLVEAAGTAGAHWSALPDFGLAGGDIKGYWETSRFDGLLILAAAWICTRQDRVRDGIERWLADWCRENPANAGLQWKCGQEASLRLMQGLLVADLLRRWAGVRAAPAFVLWVEQHCRRIEATMMYAVAQDNNHGTSEAAALFTAGVFLLREGRATDATRATRWRDHGRFRLEERLARLVMPDGSFSQHSVNYHRLMLDTVAFAETARRANGEPAWSTRCLTRCIEATRWLDAFTDAGSGDAPNLGANDGACMFALHDAAYRDFRPTIRWARRVFMNDAGGIDERLAWLGLDAATPASGPALAAVPPRRVWPDGGYAKLDAADAWALMRLPRYRFRPGHADALHLDLWIGGENVLRDGGTFSYNTEERWLRYFAGTESHNTLQFDAGDQMPKLSRFLFGDWLECDELESAPDGSVVLASYRARTGAWHRREVVLQPGVCRVTDNVSGLRRAAVLRWRLSPGEWIATATGCQRGDLKIDIRSDVAVASLGLADGWESRHYGERTAVPVLAAEIRHAATLTTEITWRA